MPLVEPLYRVKVKVVIFPWSKGDTSQKLFLWYSTHSVTECEMSLHETERNAWAKWHPRIRRFSHQPRERSENDERPDAYRSLLGSWTLTASLWETCDKANHFT